MMRYWLPGVEDAGIVAAEAKREVLIELCDEICTGTDQGPYSGTIVPASESPIDKYVLPGNCEALAEKLLARLLQGTEANGPSSHHKEKWLSAFLARVDLEAALSFTVCAIVGLINHSALGGKKKTYDSMSHCYRKSNTPNGRQAGT